MDELENLSAQRPEVNRLRRPFREPRSVAFWHNPKTLTVELKDLTKRIASLADHRRLSDQGRYIGFDDESTPFELIAELDERLASAAFQFVSQLGLCSRAELDASFEIIRQAAIKRSEARLIRNN